MVSTVSGPLRADLGETALPRSEESERAVLGAILLDPASLDGIARTLRPEDFCNPQHQMLYRAFLDLAREGTVIDARTSQAILEQRGQLDAVGGLAYLAALDIDLPDIGRLETYAAIVKECSIRRRLIQAAEVAIQNSRDGGRPAPEALETLRSQLSRLADELPRATALRFESLEDFVAVGEDAAEPLLGTSEECALPTGGMLLMYGDGGAGKTTLSMDAMAHLASGSTWLGLSVARPLRLMVIENEGPKGRFQLTLKRKLDSWQGPSFATNVSMLAEPWARFTLANAGHRKALAEAVDGFRADVVIIGPLASIGAKGRGTPDEVNEFGELIADLRRLCRHPFALWIVHHENKSGDVSGAWGRVPDTLLHVQAQGNGRTRVHWRKARWSSELHDTSWNLTWDGAGGFRREEPPPARDYRGELLRVLQDGAWHPLTQVAGTIGAHHNKVRPILSSLVEEGILNFMEGAPGCKKNAKCYRLSACTQSTDRHVQADNQNAPRPTCTPVPT